MYDQYQGCTTRIEVCLPQPMHLPQAKKYKRTLDSLMSFVHGLDNATGCYGPDRVYTAEEMNAITPDHVVRWMKLKTNGTPDPDDCANATGARSSSLKYWKTLLSFLCQIICWDGMKIEVRVILLGVRWSMILSSLL